MLFDKKNIKRYQVLVSIKIRNFLLSKNTREFLIFLFFVLVSFSFWLLQMLDNVYQADFKMQVRLRDVPKEVVMTSELPSEVSVQVEDRGTVLLNYLLGRSFYPLVFDFVDYEDMGSAVVFSKNEVRKKIAAQLNTSTKLLSFRPDTLGFIYAKGDAKRVPLAINGKVTAGREFYISEVKIEPDSVMVYAPEGVLKSLHTVYTSPLSMQGLSENETQNVKLQKIKGAKFVPSTATVSVAVDMYSEKKIEVPVVGVGFPAGKMLRTFPGKVQICCQVGLNKFSSVSAKDFSIEVSYDELMNSNGDQIQLKLTKAPSHVGHVRIVPSEVDYLIEERFAGDVNDKEEEM